MSFRSDRVRAEAQHVERELRAIGENNLADKVMRLRHSHIVATNTLRTLHRDNMELRQRLGMPSFLDCKTARKSKGRADG